MKNFSQHIERLLKKFEPFLTRQAVVSGEYFTKDKALVSQFVEEIKQSVQLLQQQDSPEYAEVYAEKLLRQFDALNKAVALLSKEKQRESAFRSAYHFPKNVHALSPEKRLIEYRKALRALNDKISWLVEKQLSASHHDEYQQLKYQIDETEYRKMRCLAAIEELEELTSYKN